MIQVLQGTVDNGRRATLASSLYSGEVGVRDRGDGQLELAWFGRPRPFRSAITGTLDGEAITITGQRSRETGGGGYAAQASSLRAIIATAEAG